MEQSRVFFKNLSLPITVADGMLAFHREEEDGREVSHVFDARSPAFRLPCQSLSLSSCPGLDGEERGNEPSAPQNSGSKLPWA